MAELPRHPWRVAGRQVPMRSWRLALADSGNAVVDQDGSSAPSGNAWRLVADSEARVEPVPNEQLRQPDPGQPDRWESLGGRPCFLLDCGKHDNPPLPPGWYELSGHLDVEHGTILLPSLHPRYVSDSALTSGELTLPAPDASGRIRALLMFFDDVQSLAFYPSISPAIFRMRDFRVRRVSRLHALRAMLGDPLPGARSAPGPAGRALAWGRNALANGLKRAADDLHADYRRRLRPPGLGDYDIWTRKYDTIGELELATFKQRAATLGERGPRISVLLPLHDIPEFRLRGSLDSVLAQAWQKWELCVVPSAADMPATIELLDEYARGDARIRVAAASRTPAAALDAALAMASGEFIAVLDAGDQLRPHTLLEVAEATATDPDLAIVYSDEDAIDDQGKRSQPNFKPDWNPDLLHGQDYLHRLVAIRAELAREAGGFRSGYHGAQDYDLVLRCVERTTARQIRHIPAILYHRQDPAMSIVDADTAAAAGARALAGHLEQIAAGATVVPSDRPAGHYHVRWPLPTPPPKISLIIPTRDRVGLLRMCVESILAKSTYPEFELVVVDNQSRDGAALDYLRALEARERVRVLRYDAPFNYSAINNWAARECDGQVLGLVNNDIEVITPDWLEEMAGFAVRPDTGAVGAMLYYPDDTIQHAGVLLGMLGLAGHINCRMPRGYAGHAGRGLVAQGLSAVTGACLLVRRAVFEEVGGLDERLAVAFNDVDFCLRVRERGYRNVWTPFAEMYHHESASRGIDDTDAKRLRFTSEVAFMMKRWGGALREDPAYNPNLSLQTHNFELAFPPRVRRRPV